MVNYGFEGKSHKTVEAERRIKWNFNAVGKGTPPDLYFFPLGGVLFCKLYYL